MNQYKVLIPSAGLGTRLGDFSKNLNKALVSLDNKPVISHVIEKFPKHIEIVVALGHKGDLVKDYLQMAHSDRQITCVDIENYCGNGSGLGLTILECKEYLQCPFVFCPNDTVILEEVPEPVTNWVGYAEVENNHHYRSFKLSDDGLVERVCEKEEILSYDTKPYIGLAGIKDYETFWKAMEDGKKYGSIKIGESYGLREMVKQNISIQANKFTWYDTGNLESLTAARELVKSKDAPEILEKANEAIWFVNDRVIKYNSDPKFISNRAQRANLLKGYVPEITSVKNNMYSYRMLTGKTMSKATNQKTFKKLLDYLMFFWEPVELDKQQAKGFNEVCRKFYKEKTEKRIELYFNRFSEKDCVEKINGSNVPTIQELLERVDWQKLFHGSASRMHGDLHFENILVAETGDFYLLDWRQDFGGITEYGDIYYDLAKLLHGLIVSHELINKNHYEINQMDNVITYDLYRKHCLVENEKQFYDFLHEHNFDVYKVKLLTSLIFLNIAPLHHYPYSKMLFYLGKESLYNILGCQDE